MLSYMIFLGVAILAQIAFGWDGLNRIAIAATIAGCFFAFADLAGWYISHKTPLIDTLQKEFEVGEDHYFALLDSITLNEQEAENIIQLLSEHRNRGSNIGSMIETSTNFIGKLNQCRTSLDDARNQNLILLRRISKSRKNASIISKVEASLMTIGFVLFFSLIAFDWLLSILSPHQELATVLAFIVIMLNYYLREILEEKTENVVNEMLTEIDSRRKNVEDLRGSFEETPMFDIVKKFVDELEQEDKREEA